MTIHKPDAIAPTVSPEAATILREARARISNPRRWIQGQLFDSKDGERCYCIDGAVFASQPTSAPTGAGLCVSITAKNRGYETASKFNDAKGRKHAEILGFMDEAIALAESLAERPS